MIIAKIKKVHPDAVIPKYATEGSACFDLHSIENQVISSDRHAAIRTGLSFEIPEGYAMLVFPRSGNAAKHRVNLMNCVGVIDSDYRGEVMALINNESKGDFIVRAGDRIAQAAILQVPMVQLMVVDELSDTQRGAGGFGSTGK